MHEALRREVGVEHREPRVTSIFLSRTSALDPLWWAVSKPVTAGLLREDVIDFYAGLIDRRWTSRRVVAEVDAIWSETPDVRSIVLRTNRHFRGFVAGQHVNVTVEIDGVRHTRTYSPSNAPDASGRVVLTVKRHPGGLVSSWLHRHLRVGALLELSQAFGELVVSEATPPKLLLIGGGSGVTPLMSLLRDRLARDPAADVSVLLYAPTYAERIFAGALTQLAARHAGVRVHFVIPRAPRRARELHGHFGAAHLDHVAPDAAERALFVCGPRSLVADVTALARSRRYGSTPKTESFAPFELTQEDDVLGRQVRVTAARTGRAFVAKVGQPLLAQAEAAGLNPVSGCRQGVCRTCTCTKQTGVVQNMLSGVISSEPNEHIKLCVSRPLSDLTLEL